MEFDKRNFNGTLVYKGEVCQFSFSDFKLTIETEDIHVIGGNEGLDVCSFVGNIAHFPKKVLFFFDKQTPGFNLSAGGFSSSNIQIYIKYYIVLNSEFYPENLKVCFKNNEFQKWLDVYLTYTSKDVMKIPDRIKIKQNGCKRISNVILNNKRFLVKPGYSVSTSNVNYHFDCKLEFECLDKMEPDDIYQLAYIFHKSLKFIFYRTKVDIGIVELFSKQIISGKNYYVNIGELVANFEMFPFEHIDLNHRFQYGFMPWELLFKRYNLLLNLINDDDIYVYNLPETRLGKFSTSLPSIFATSAAFECEFNKCFPNFKTFKLNSPLHKAVFRKINELDFTSKQKEVKDGLLSNFYYPSLGERFTFAVNYFNDFLIKLNDGEKKADIYKIIEDFKKTRNTVDHGKLPVEITELNTDTFYYARILVYCMQLKRLKFSKKDIQKSINLVFSHRNNR